LHRCIARNKKAARRRPIDPKSDDGSPEKRGAASLDFGFLEIDMLANDRIIFPHVHFLGHGPAVLFGHVEIAGISRRKQFYLDCYGLGHDSSPSETTRRAKRIARLQIVALL
jgi:hypothetical protein